MKIPYGTIALILIAVTAYLVMSEGQLYVNPVSKMYDYGVKSDPVCIEWKDDLCYRYSCLEEVNNTCQEYEYQVNFLGAFTYAFMHVGIKHLLINMLILFAIGWVAERKIESKHLLGIFLSSSVIAGIGYALISKSWVIGSSAGIAGLPTCIETYGETEISYILEV